MQQRNMLYVDTVKDGNHIVDRVIWGFYKTKEALKKAKHELQQIVNNRDVMEGFGFIVGFHNIDWEE